MKRIIYWLRYLADPNRELRQLVRDWDKFNQNSQDWLLAKDRQPR